MTSVNLNQTYIWHLRIWSWFPFDRQVRLVQLRRFCKWFRKQFHSKCCKFQDLQHHHCKFSPMDCGKLSPFHWKAEKKISDHLLLMDLRKKSTNISTLSKPHKYQLLTCKIFLWGLQKLEEKFASQFPPLLHTVGKSKILSKFSFHKN